MPHSNTKENTSAQLSIGQKQLFCNKAFSFETTGTANWEDSRKKSLKSMLHSVCEDDKDSNGH